MINFYHIPIKRKRQDDVLAGKTNLRFISELMSQLRILLKKKKKKENVQLRTRFDKPFRFYDLKNCGRGRGKKVTSLGALTQPNVYCTSTVNCTPI